MAAEMEEQAQENNQQVTALVAHQVHVNRPCKLCSHLLELNGDCKLST